MQSMPALLAKLEAQVADRSQALASCSLSWDSLGLRGGRDGEGNGVVSIKPMAALWYDQIAP